MALSTQPYKGARDFYPEDKRLLNYIFWQWIEVAESFGYEEYNAPLLEPLEIYTAKTGEEIVNEQTYVFEDRGGRKVTIRPEMTPSVSRMVAAKRQELAYPLRWYSIPVVWRYERPQRGRLREHWQLNVDLFGVDGIEAEMEMIQMADALMQAFGAKRSTYKIRLNSRKLVDTMLKEYVGSDKKKTHDTIKLIDRMLKMPKAEFNKKLAEIIPKDMAKALGTVLEVNDLEGLPKRYSNHPSVAELRRTMAMAEKLGITNVEFDASLMRGFDYYTDIVFEVFDTNPDNNRSMFGGGRYSGLVGLFGAKPLEAVGFGMGDVTLENFLKSHKLVPKLKTETDIYAILIGDVYEKAQDVLSGLRKADIDVAVDMTGRKLDKQIKSADKKGIKYAMFIGDKELKDKKYKLKDLESGKEYTFELQEIINLLS